MNISKQYREALSTFSHKNARISPKKERNTRVAKLKSLMKFRPVFKKDDTVISKINQIEKLLISCDYHNQGKRFVFSIDEHRYPLLSGKVIDNMPIDYSLVVDYSLQDLKTIIGNRVKDDNRLKMIQVLEEYIDRFCSFDADNPSMLYIKGLKKKKAGSLEEALQRILFINQILWQTRHTLVGLGRLDKLLDRFKIDSDTEKIIIDFLITLHSFYNYKSSALLGDTGQIIVLGGLESDGTYFFNDYTSLFIRGLKSVRLPDPKCLLRASAKMPEELLELAIDCIATGIGSPLLSNDDVVVPLLVEFGYEREDAYNYGVSACWEPLAIGKSFEQNNLAHIEYGIAAHKMVIDEQFEYCRTKQDIRNLFAKHLKETVTNAINAINRICWEVDPIETLFSRSCLKNGEEISVGGSDYNNYGILSVGLATAVNSLLNIQHLCLDRQKYSLHEVRDAIMRNYAGYDNLKLDFLSATCCFGSDNEEAIQLANGIIRETESLLNNYRNKLGGRVKFGLSSPVYISSGKNSGATADGRNAGTPFATHISRDTSGSITQILNFASQLEFSALSCNANVVDVIIQPNLFWENKAKYLQLIMSAIKMGVFQMQFNVVSYKQLIDAKEHPEKYPDLIVRVWGFSAYFRELPEHYQNQLIHRAQKSEGIV